MNRKINLFLLVAMLISTASFAQSLSGTTWSYTTRMYGSNKISTATTYFHFDSPTKVIWMLGTPDGKAFPVAIGNYNPVKGEITFPASTRVNQYSELFKYGRDIVFSFQPSKCTMQVLSGEAQKHGLMTLLYNSLQQFTVVKEKYPFQPSKTMVGQTWGGYVGYGGDSFEYLTIQFKNQYEADITVEYDDGSQTVTCPYVCLGNIVAVHSGDHFTNLVLIGQYFNGSNSIVFCWEGIEGREVEHFDQPCSSFSRIK